MIKLIAPLVLGLLSLQSPLEAKDYRNKVLDLRFSLPASWKVQEKKDVSILTFPVADGTAQLELRATSFRQPAETWQTLQNQVNTDSSRTVLRQWDEDLLGAKLLLTEVETRITKVLVGLHYTSGAKKLQFRLTSPSAGYDDAVQEWRTVLQSLRQLSTIPVGSEITNESTGVVVLGSSAERKPTLAPQKLDMKVSNREMTFRFPKDWTISETAPYVLTNSKAGMAVNLEFRNIVDSPAPGELLMALVNEDLKRFSQVKSRENKGPVLNRAGLTTFTVFRIGIAEEKPLYSFMSVGERAGFYFLMSWSDSVAPTDWSGKLKVLRVLNEQLGIETKS